MNKYKNKKVVIDGIKYDSKKEAKRGIQLRQLEAEGKITNLQMQVRFTLQPSFKFKGKTIRKIEYIADFVYKDDKGNLVIEDTKGYRTEIYKIKKKIMQYKGYDIKEL